MLKSSGESVLDNLKHKGLLKSHFWQLHPHNKLGVLGQDWWINSKVFFNLLRINANKKSWISDDLRWQPCFRLF